LFWEGQLAWGVEEKGCGWGDRGFGGGERGRAEGWWRCKGERLRMAMAMGIVGTKHTFRSSPFRGRTLTLKPGIVEDCLEVEEMMQKTVDRVGCRELCLHQITGEFGTKNRIPSHSGTFPLVSQELLESG